MKRIITLLLFICLLCGCASPSAAEGSTVPEEETTLPVQTLPTVAPNTYVEEAVELPSVSKLSFCKTTESPSVAVLDERAVAFVTAAYLNKDYSRKYTSIRLIDPYADAVRGELLLEGAYTVLPYSGGTGTMALVSGDEILVLDKDLRQVLTFRAESGNGVLSGDLARYYYVWGSNLYALDTTTGQRQRCDAARELLLDEIWGYDVWENRLLVSVFEDTYTTNLCMGAVDLDDGSFDLLYRGISAGNLAENGICLELSHVDLLNSDLYYGDWDDGQMKILPGFLVNNADYAGWHIPGSDYVCRFTYDAAQKVSIEEFELFRLGATVEVCSLQEEMKGAKINAIHILPDGNLLALAVSSRGYQSYVICPDQLEFRPAVVDSTQGTALVDATILENYVREPEFDLPESLAKVRAQADELEDTYGITILLSGQCKLAASYCDMPITTTDEAGLHNEAISIREVLNKLESVLKMYPKDFFLQFRNEAGERGLLVLLVEDISAELNVIGVSYTMGQWYPVAIDITSPEVRSTYFHEIWHATENRINDLDAGALDLEAWENCNPPGFRYSGNTTPSYIEDTANTFFYGAGGEEVYFVDPYGKTKGQEDRARLMEYVMATEWDARMMMEHPILKAKLQILCDAIREAFVSDHWDNLYWERFF